MNKQEFAMIRDTARERVNKGLQKLKETADKQKATRILQATVKRPITPLISDYRQASQILQATVKRQQAEKAYKGLRGASRFNLTEQELMEMSKPYLMKDLKDAWKTTLYNLTIYAKPLNRLKKFEVYHELINMNYDFSKLQKKQPRPRGRPRRNQAP